MILITFKDLETETCKNPEEWCAYIEACYQCLRVFYSNEQGTPCIVLLDYPKFAGIKLGSKHVDND